MFSSKHLTVINEDTNEFFDCLKQKYDINFTFLLIRTGCQVTGSYIYSQLRI